MLSAPSDGVILASLRLYGRFTALSAAPRSDLSGSTAAAAKRFVRFLHRSPRLKLFRSIGFSMSTGNEQPPTTPMNLTATPRSAQEGRLIDFKELPNPLGDASERSTR